MSSISVAALLKKLEEQQHKCALTGRPLTPDDCELDHVVPFGSNGAHELSNLQLVSTQANTAKGTMSVDEFVELCRDVVRQYPTNGGRVLP